MISAILMLEYGHNGGDIGYHGVHGEVVVLSLQLHGVLVTPADLGVALQEHFLVVTDPVKHLQKHQYRHKTFHLQPQPT